MPTTSTKSKKRTHFEQAGPNRNGGVKRDRSYEIPGKDYQKILAMMDELHDLFLAIEKVKTKKRLERARALLREIADAFVKPALEEIGREESFSSSCFPTDNQRRTIAWVHYYHPNKGQILAMYLFFTPSPSSFNRLMTMKLCCSVSGHSIWIRCELCNRIL